MGKLSELVFRYDDSMAVARVAVKTGETPEDQLKFWADMDKWLGSREGLAYQALMQKEFEALYDGLMKMPLAEKNDRALAIQAARVQESSRVLNFPMVVKQRVKALQAHIKVRQQAEVV